MKTAPVRKIIRVEEASRSRISPTIVAVAVLLLVLIPVLARKESCIANQRWPGPIHWCFTQIPEFLYTEDLLSGRTPYLDVCHPPAGLPCGEYPDPGHATDQAW